MGRPADRRSNSRGAGRGSRAPARRTGPARPRPRRSRSQGPRIGWSRRLGIVAALLVGGASVVLAGQALSPAAPGQPTDQAGSGAPPTAATMLTASPPPALAAAPQLLPLEATLTNQPEVSVSGRLVEDPPRNSHRLRVYVNGELQRERRLPRRQQFTLSVPLVEGLNTITLAVNGPAGESLHSTPAEITLDSRPPAISGLTPADGDVVYAEQATLSGTAEPGATLRVTSHTHGGSTTLVIPDDGAFAVTIDLQPGANQLVLETRDRAGNEARAALSLERREGAAAVELNLSRASLELADLPASMSLRADVRDAAGEPIDGAEVIFSLSPPGAPTLTYNATTSAGVARWPSVRISDAAKAGEGLVTVLVTLADGQTLTNSAYFTIED